MKQEAINKILNSNPIYLKLENSPEICLVEIEDYIKFNLSLHKWYLDGGYAARYKYLSKRKNKIIYLTKHLTGLDYIDHIDRNKLNNLRSNFRKATFSQNACNRDKIKRACSSSFKGVCFNKEANKWIAYITKNSKKIHLGRFEQEIDAAIAYNIKAKELHGEFAVLNVV